MVSHAALTFSPMVSLVSPHTVLLEVHASLRLWGGSTALLTRFAQMLNTLPGMVDWQGAIAPTPLAATWLAQCVGPPQSFAQTHAHELKTALSALPVRVLASSLTYQATLEHLGLYSLGHVWGLPRSELSRRFGPALLQELDRALGLRPDPREPVTLPHHFDQRIELWEYTDRAAPLLEAAQGLLVHLGVWLLARQMLVSVLELVLHPTPRLQRIGEQADAQVLRLALGQATRDMAHLALLLRERLNRLTLHKPLPYAVAAMSLRTVQCVQAMTADAPCAQLFAATSSTSLSLTRLIERLQARLGVEQVQGVAMHADYRPERATRYTSPSVAQRKAQRPFQREAVHLPPQLQHARRPACLLPQPQALALRQGLPSMNGQPLRLLAGPERIETGWWLEPSTAPGLPTQRDYYVAEASSHALLWVFREAASGAAPGSEHVRWFLHGHFG
jgi:protein ImuB